MAKKPPAKKPKNKPHGDGKSEKVPAFLKNAAPAMMGNTKKKPGKK